MVVNKITMPSQSNARRMFFNKKMSGFHSGTDNVQNGEMASVMESFQKKGSLSQRPIVTTAAQQVIENSTSSSTSSRVAKTSLSSKTSSSSSQRLHHHLTSSSTSELKASSMKSDIAELKSSISEMKTISEMKNLTNTEAMQDLNERCNRLCNSMENLVDNDQPDTCAEPLVTFPDDAPIIGVMPGAAVTNQSTDTLKFEEKRTTSTSISKVVADGISTEQEEAESAHMARLDAGSLSYYKTGNAAARRARVDVNGVSAERSALRKEEQVSLKAGDVTQQDTQSMEESRVRLTGDTFSAEHAAVAAQQARHTTVTSGSMSQHVAATSSHQQSSNITITSSKGMCASKTSSLMQAAQMSSQLLNGTVKEDDLLQLGFDDLAQLCSNSNQQDVERAITKYSAYLDNFVKSLRRNESITNKAPALLNKINDIMSTAWAVPTYGHELGYSLCNALRKCGGLDLLMSNCMTEDRELQFSSAQLLEQCLTTENRAHVVKFGLDKVVRVACVCTKNSNSVDHSRVGTGILEHLFKHSEGTCSDVIRLGGLDAVLFECRKNDVETLRHCAGALANLSLYGGAENQEAMIKRKVPMWLFPLAFHNDDNIKYYACLAIAVLVANKEIEAAVLQSGTLDLVEPFVMSHNPSEFAKSNLAHAHGQSKNWLQRLVPVLSSKREAARNLAAFHFCMEAGIKKQQGNTEIFNEIGAIEPLKKVASCPNAVASKYAAQALRLMGEEVPHKLSQQVPLWSTEDVQEWVKQIGFAEYANNFVESRVDGDLLLQLTEENLSDDIGLTNGIRRRRFTRELQNLKKMADYSSRDTGNLNSFLQTIGPEFSIYTYSMLNAGVDKDSIRNLSEDQLVTECGITNSIHRLRILDAIRSVENNFSSPFLNEESRDKSLDVFVSYRRSNGSQLASLLKVHLQLRGFTVFIDVERLEAGKFDNNLLQSIHQAKHFLLVLTPKALDRCSSDVDCKDWVHKEIVAALQSQCNIIPIIDNFTWPEPEDLPEDMRAVCHFNGVRWIHDYQDACVDKLERFLRGEMKPDGGVIGRAGTSLTNKGDGTPGTPASCALSRQPPAYQRMHSNESGKGSDKDVNGNSGGRE